MTRAALIAAVAAGFVIALAVPAFAQPPCDGPGNRAALAGSGIGVGIRALGMGGAHTALANDVTALYWNPAALTNIEGVKFSLPIGAQAEGIDVANEMKDVYDALKEDTMSLEEFLSLRDVAQRVSGNPVTGLGGGMAGVAFHNVGFGAFGEAGVDALLTYDAGLPETVEVEGGAAWYYSAGAGLAHQISPSTSVGIGVRKLWARYRTASYTAERNGTTITKTGSNPPTYEDDDVAVDLGFLFEPSEALTAGLMIRSINSPNLTFTNGVGAPQKFEIDECVNLGLAFHRPGCTWAVDVHNLLDASGAGPSLHVGVEKFITGSLALRAGFNDGDLGFGLGGYLGALSIQLAVDEDFENMAGLELGLAF